MSYILDIECYRNYFLMVWLPVKGAPLIFEQFNDEVTINTTADIDWSATMITFNGINYDFPMWGGLWAKKTNSELKDISDAIILNRLMPWDVEREFNIVIPSFDHIDIAQVLPLMASLKVYGARINAKKLQDLPVEPDTILTREQADIIRNYCINDDRVTRALADEIAPQIDLRVTMGEQYDLDLRSKSDAQIAEAVIASEYQKRTGQQLWKPDTVEPWYRYTPPPFIGFHGVAMQTKLAEIRMAVFNIKPSNGQVEEPPILKVPVELGDVKYKMGLGGLHSVDKPGSFYSDDEYVLYDIDVASYYPFIILIAGYYPAHIGEVFLEIYREIVERRIAAKRSGDKVTADSLKIVINGSFGKLGSKYSKLYSPDLMFHVTVTGQLALLMLIEQFPRMVVSANTDGITVKIPRDLLAAVQTTVATWEQHTGFEMEWTEYKSVHRRDVNNYIAILSDAELAKKKVRKPGDEVKRKGVFTKPGLSKNPANPIIYDAIIEYFQHGTPVYESVTNCQDITRFLTLRTVKGGALWNGELLGKSVRWYHSWLSDTTINYKTNGNKVPLSDGSVPLQDLPDTMPKDVNHQWYIDEANKLLEMML